MGEARPRPAITIISRFANSELLGLSELVVMTTRSAFILAAVVAGCAPQPSQQALFQVADEWVDQHGQCEEPARNRGLADGCYLDTSINLGPMPSQLYWHIDHFSDVESAEAARSLQGSVTVTFGNQVFLQTINDNPSWRPSTGEHLGTVGPLTVSGGADLTARLMEATTSTPATISLHAPSGPKAIFQLVGSACVETPQGARRMGRHESLVIPRDTPMQLQSSGQAVSRSLILVIHPTDQPWTDGKSAWVPKLLCK